HSLQVESILRSEATKDLRCGCAKRSQIRTPARLHQRCFAALSIDLQEMTAENAHSFRPSAISKESSTSSKFMRPAVSVKAVPYSNVMEVMSPKSRMPRAMKYGSPAPIEPMVARSERTF